jgi:drug/metabolite transporter (DMT)-like permease
MPFVWVTPSPADLLLMAGQGIVAAIGHFLIIRAYEQAPAPLLVPFTYSRIIGMSALAYLAFDEFPDGWTWTGIAILAASGIYISFRERRLGKPPPAEAR